MSPLKYSLCAAVLAVSMATITAQAQTVAVIDGTKISKSELDAFAKMRTGEVPIDTNREMLIDQLADLIVLSNVAIKGKLDKTDEMRAQLELQRRSVLAQAAVTDFIENNSVSDAELKAEYDKQIATVAGQEQFKARHILVEEQAEAVAIIAELKSGADFAELAKEKSTGPSGPQGGDLGWFDGNAMVAEFSRAVAQMENGAYSQIPVQTQFGWHVILREDSRSAEPPSFDEVSDRLRQGMEQQRFQAYFDDIKANAEREVM
ncbi:MAG: peptidylprolyl isomerase [Pseudomonadota bacterium]